MLLVGSIYILGQLDQVLLSARLVEGSAHKEFIQHSDFLNGLGLYTVHLQQHTEIGSVDGITWFAGDSDQCLEFSNFPPGSVLIIK